MSNLTQEDLEVLERLRKADDERQKIPESERFPISHPDKYSFPLGLDDNGNPFPEEAKDWWKPKP